MSAQGPGPWKSFPGKAQRCLRTTQQTQTCLSRVSFGATHFRKQLRLDCGKSDAAEREMCGRTAVSITKTPGRCSFQVMHQWVPQNLRLFLDPFPETTVIKGRGICFVFLASSGSHIKLNNPF